MILAISSDCVFSILFSVFVIFCWKSVMSYQVTGAEVRILIWLVGLCLMFAVAVDVRGFLFL